MYKRRTDIFDIIMNFDILFYYFCILKLRSTVRSSEITIKKQTTQKPVLMGKSHPAIKQGWAMPLSFA
jgi:hypothetical protein